MVAAGIYSVADPTDKLRFRDVEIRGVKVESDTQNSEPLRSDRGATESSS